MAEIRSYRVGQRVRCERAAPTNIVWKRFAGRTGTVDSNHLGEVGVIFQGESVYWFHPHELVKVSE
jgi:hypothetical protein